MFICLLSQVLCCRLCLLPPCLRLHSYSCLPACCHRCYAAVFASAHLASASTLLPADLSELLDPPSHHPLQALCPRMLWPHPGDWRKSHEQVKAAHATTTASEKEGGERWQDVLEDLPICRRERCNKVSAAAAAVVADIFNLSCVYWPRKCCCSWLINILPIICSILFHLMVSGSTLLRS